MIQITLDFQIEEEDLDSFREGYYADCGKYPTKKEVREFYKQAAEEWIRQGDIQLDLNNTKILVTYGGMIL